MARFVVLLRGINVNGRSLPMKELREAAQAGGFPDCATYIQSGNLVLSGEGDAAGIEAEVESLIGTRFGMNVEVIAREAADLARIAAANPFPGANPKALHLGLTKRPLKAGAAEALLPRAVNGEEIAEAAGALWVNFAKGVAGSKIMPAVLDKAAGSTLTARNWNTVQKLLEMAQG